MFKHLKRKDDGVIQNNKDGSSTCLKDIKVVVPARFEKLGLCNINIRVDFYGVAAIVYDDKFYKLLNMPSLISITPFRTERVTYNGVDYYMFNIRKGEPFANRNLIVDTSVIKPVSEEFLIKGVIPWYMDYFEIREMFDNFYTYCGSKIADDVVIMDVMVSLLARTKRDYKIHWRNAKPTDTIDWIGVANVPISRADGFNKLTGAYLNDGIISSSLDEIDEPTQIETIIK
jgi:hypothetical protein